MPKPLLYHHSPAIHRPHPLSKGPWNLFLHEVMPLFQKGSLGLFWGFLGQAIQGTGLSDIGKGRPAAKWG